MRQLRYFLRSLFPRVTPSIAKSILVVVGVAVLFWCAPLAENPPPLLRSSSLEPLAPGPFERLAIKLKRGDTLLTVLTRHGVQPPSAHDLIAKVRPLMNLRKMRTGDRVALVVDSENRAVQELEVPLGDNIVRAKTTPQGWTVEREAIPWTAVTRVVRDTISNSLYENGVAAGLSPEHILDLAVIFEYDIDFFSDFKRGAQSSDAKEAFYECS